VHFDHFDFDDQDDEALSQMLEHADVAQGTVPHDAFYTFLKAKLPLLYDSPIDDLIYNCPKTKETEADIHYLNEKMK
jgi:hypothetical protein